MFYSSLSLYRFLNREQERSMRLTAVPKLFAPLSLVLSVLTASQAWAQNTPSTAALLDEHCVKCHNSEDWAGSLDMATLDYAHVEKEAETWELIIRKLNAGMMPPQSEPRPDQQTLKKFVSELEQRLDTQVASLPAAPALHRLNRNEYHNAIRDLFALEVDVTPLLPSDDATEGFDNVAAGLGISPALIQGYTTAAMKISRAAVGDPTTTETAKVYRTAGALAQDRHLEGMPLGTRGGLRIAHNFPLDAEYTLSVRGGAGFGRDPSVLIDITIDGQPFKATDVRAIRLPFTAGEHVLTVAVRDSKRPTGVNDIYSVYNVGGGINSVEINGPFNPTGTGNTVSRQRVFSCYPKSNDEERSCAKQILQNIGTQAFREPLTEQEAAPLLSFYDQGRQQGSFEDGVQQALARVLVDPRFLFRFEEEPANVAPGDIYTISDFELASRLSFFLWSSIPDQDLLTLAAKGELHKPAVLHQQIARMLNDDKAQALIKNFVGQWLFLRQLAGATPEATAFDDNLRQAFSEETELLIGSVIAEDLPVTQLLDMDYTFLNERLAKHYGIANVRGSHFRRVDLPKDSPRRGLLGQGSILTVTSTASRTSPVIRGSWILENLLNAPVPAPPPGVETNLDGDGTVKLTSSVRERLEAHRTDPVCKSCHSVIDPVGFSLENYDMIGAWRTQDGDSAVDPRGILANGTPVSSPNDLRNALMQQSDLFVATMTQKLMIYALGRPVEYHDMPTVRAILRDAAKADYRFTALVEGIVQSKQFTQRVKSGGSTTAQR
jgi:hypothetical protein